MKQEKVYLNPNLKAGHGSLEVGAFKVFVFNIMLRRNVNEARAAQIANSAGFAMHMRQKGNVRVGMAV